MKTLAALFLFLPTLASGQTFFEGALFATHVSETGPVAPRNEFFSTNWFRAGVTRGSMTFRVRGSFEPFTIQREGYPQLLQTVSRESGGPLFDSMRAHDALGEAALDVRRGALHVYLAPVGEPPLGAEPYERRASSTEFAEAPFSYDVAEGWRHATRVVAAGVQKGALQFDGGVFHEAVTFGRHTTLEDGPIDSWSARAIIKASPNVALQLSHGSLGDAQEKVTSASVSHTTQKVAVSALWTRRASRNAYAAEATAHLGRHVPMLRAERVVNRTHLTLGYIFDLLTNPRWRTGVGANVDYHTQTKELRSAYGHKPQSVYLFVRVRTTSGRG